MPSNPARANVLKRAIELHATKLERQEQAAQATKEVMKVLQDQLDLFQQKPPK